MTEIAEKWSIQPEVAPATGDKGLLIDATDGESKLYALDLTPVKFSVLNIDTTNKDMNNTDLSNLKKITNKNTVKTISQITYAPTINLEWTTESDEQFILLTGNLTIGSSNGLIAGSQKSLNILGDSVNRLLVINSDWTPLGNVAPQSIPANKEAWIYAFSDGLTDISVSYVYVEQA